MNKKESKIISLKQKSKENKENKKQKINNNDKNNKTLSINEKKIIRRWFLVDAENKILGRLSTKVASVLKGKSKTDFTHNIDNGDYVTIINASKIVLTGKKWKQKKYYRHSGFPGGLKKITAFELKNKFPNKIVERSIFGMLPKTKLGEKMRKKLFIYSEKNHKHESQKPIIIEV
ncbi:50S ribosomal protein L13 [Texas Phoenix palm phytoplasma]|uniref:Large ribosomal subunit protein uL13 n=1 Tax=Texas Phoenix palm phytoplasma TaxID=176709 RepID=A0ABS5BJI9_9MOLU|nr:50S ribosomal protein L13 [Texas Phoenix palm phytoplasma]MBP3059310.1 50S ribosomal protein L13 [Texas Phoenix palm phytoplasma]MBP3059359.1 50S ribosomal protein L13 [Texas Phoenix palm phytoplasma]